MVLWTGCFIGWLEFLTRGIIKPQLWTDCKLFYFLYYFWRQYSSWILVLMSVEKCFAIYFPLKSKTLCTVRTAKLATGITGVIITAYNINHFFTNESYFEKLYGFHICIFTSNTKVINILNTVDSVLYSLGPFALMLITNFSIAVKFMRSKCKNGSTESTDQSLSKAATRGTVTVVTVSVAFLLLTGLTAVNLAVPGTNYLSNNPIYSTCMIVTLYLNHSINGLLYCLVGSKFREEFFKIFCRKKTPQGISNSQCINTSSLTTISTGRF